jgi:hypothetical protein
MLVPAVQLVDYALRKALTDANIPFDSVSIGEPFNRATWTVQYAVTATDPQKAQGASIVATLDPADPTVIANVKADLANPRASEELMKAVAQASYEVAQSPATFPTLLSYRNRILTLFRSFL